MVKLFIEIKKKSFIFRKITRQIINVLVSLSTEF